MFLSSTYSKINGKTYRKQKYNNKYLIQAYDSTMFGNVYIGFIDFMLNHKVLLNYTNLYSSNDYENNNKMIK